MLEPTGFCSTGLVKPNATWEKMKLIELVRDLDTLDERSTIYVSPPWSDASEAIVAYEPEAGGTPSEATRLNLEYFLEVFVARIFMEEWTANRDTRPTIQQMCTRLIEYAANDT
jgi:hypothetical protein